MGVLSELLSDPARLWVDGWPHPTHSHSSSSIGSHSLEPPVPSLPAKNRAGLRSASNMQAPDPLLQPAASGPRREGIRRSSFLFRSEVDEMQKASAAAPTDKDPEADKKEAAQFIDVFLKGEHTEVKEAITKRIQDAPAESGEPEPSTSQEAIDQMAGKIKVGIFIERFLE